MKNLRLLILVFFVLVAAFPTKSQAQVDSTLIQFKDCVQFCISSDLKEEALETCIQGCTTIICCSKPESKPDEFNFIQDNPTRETIREVANFLSFWGVRFNCNTVHAHVAACCRAWNRLIDAVGTIGEYGAISEVLGVCYGVGSQ